MKKMTFITVFVFLLVAFVSCDNITSQNTVTTSETTTLITEEALLFEYHIEGNDVFIKNKLPMWNENDNDLKK